MIFSENYSLSSSRRSSSSSPSPWSGYTPNSQPARSVSPCSFESSRHPSGYSVTDLAACFATSRLRPEAQISYDSCAAYANPDDDAAWQLSDDDDDTAACARTPRACVPRLPPSSRRVQRQLQSRMLCSSSHHRDISALVAQMVEAREQCTVAGAPGLVGADVVPSIEACAPVDDDEGYDSCGLSPLSVSSSSTSLNSSTMRSSRLEYRRSADVATSRTCVAKSARLRKARKETPRRARS